MKGCVQLRSAPAMRNQITICPVDFVATALVVRFLAFFACTFQYTFLLLIVIRILALMWQ
jgi:hypothetical protein